MQKRLKKNINIEQSQSLKSKLTIPLELYETCERMVVDLTQFKEISILKRYEKIKTCNFC